ncbi:hypothetical protein M011DRAFT_448672 [Sporormia fimetaria CBS 119925]|uniref:Zn(2)-C6 fungal-type domain-containing protein n=1 Tax=Sporormia fimetaria CBS 119925 TaxID=1340428 RepID=A0A6A6V549_9PLEO|nr:hypothetical protein M011DRAFT_448672 [Sporormia fimetaria CBS 119925]
MAAPAPETADQHATASTLSHPYDGTVDTPQDHSQTDAPDRADDPDQPSPITEDASEQQLPKPVIGQMQKRRRVTRACDECRRKKIKCDGKQPCTHCTVYSYDCTYDQPSNRRRNAAPQYVEALETQLKRAKAILTIVFPTLDLNDPSLDVPLQNGLLPQLPMRGLRPQLPPQPPQPQQPYPEAPLPPRPQDTPADEPQDSHLESMVRATGQLDLDEEGNWDYHGHSSGLSFMRRLQQQTGDIIMPPSPGSSPFVRYRRPLSQVFDSPASAHQSPVEHATTLPAGTDLPTKEEARVLCENALIDAGALMRVVHLPSFYRSMDRIYDVPSENYGNAENTFLPLLYAVLALGTLFSKRDAGSDETGYEACIDDGFKYFKASRQLLDIADCRDLTSLQAIVFMIQFLQSSAKLSTCYAYVGVALRSALRQGLHRSFNVNFSVIESETRKRLFWTIRKMDIYVGVMLGLPTFLDDSDVDQEHPAEVDDEYITETEIRPMPEGTLSILAASNAHTKIVLILEKICKVVYPIKGTHAGGQNAVSYSVSYSEIRELEKDLQRWLDELPMALRPGGDPPQTIMRAQQLLRMGYGHAQLLLYRPFLHYVAQTYQSKPIDPRAFACASACVNVSRNIIHITVEMKRRRLLYGAYWFSMYTTFFAIISILYYVLENPDMTGSQELFREALDGKEVLAHFAKKSMAADRCTATLNLIFERLPERIKNTQNVQNMANKKRRQGSSPHVLQSRPAMDRNELAAASLRRASTFPETMPDSKRTAGITMAVPPHPLGNFAGDVAYGHPPPQSTPRFFETAPGLPSPRAPQLGAYGVPPGPVPPQHTGLAFAAAPLGGNYMGANLNVPLSDVNAMMFPSTDPFAYPNQPMTTFENSRPQDFREEASPSVEAMPFGASSDAAHNNGGFATGVMPTMGPRRPADNDVELVGPMPMYLMQGAQQQGPRRFPPRTTPHNPHLVNTPETGAFSFDDLMGGEEWANTFMDQSLGLSGVGTGFSGNPNVHPGSMPGWR